MRGPGLQRRLLSAGSAVVWILRVCRCLGAGFADELRFLVHKGPPGSGLCSLALLLQVTQSNQGPPHPVLEAGWSLHLHRSYLGSLISAFEGFSHRCPRGHMCSPVAFPRVPLKISRRVHRELLKQGNPRSHPYPRLCGKGREGAMLGLHLFARIASSVSCPLDLPPCLAPLGCHSALGDSGGCYFQKPRGKERETFSISPACWGPGAWAVSPGIVGKEDPRET